MIYKNITTIWQGQLGVHERYVNQAKETGQDLALIYDGKQMTIPHANLEKGWKSVQTHGTGGSDTYHLIYFKWMPDDKQQDKMI